MLDTREVNVLNIKIGANNPIALIIGPCQIESRDHVMFMAERI